MPLLFSFLFAFFAVPTNAHAEPVTAALFGAAFAASLPGAIVSIGISIAASRGYSLLRKK